MKTWSRGVFGISVAIAALLAVMPGEARVSGRVAVKSLVLLHVDVLNVRSGETTTMTSFTVEVWPDEGGAAEMEIPWPGPDAPSRLTLDVTGGAGDLSHSVSLQASVELADGNRVRTDRHLRMSEGSTYLWDVFEQPETRLLLALQAEDDHRPILEDALAGAPVRFLIEIVRVEGERTVSLETNQLSTFLGQRVDYSFRRGQNEQAEAVELSIRPVRIDGNLAEVVVEVTANLPGQPDRLLLSRRESLFTTRRAVSALTVASGDPPAGYRFLITPYF